MRSELGRILNLMMTHVRCLNGRKPGMGGTGKWSIVIADGRVYLVICPIGSEILRSKLQDLRKCESRGTTTRGAGEDTEWPKGQEDFQKDG